MRLSRLPACAAGTLLVIAGAGDAASASPPTAAHAPRASAELTHAAPTMTYCVLNVRAAASPDGRLLHTLRNRNGGCPGNAGHDTVRCWVYDCGGQVQGGTYRCSSGSAQRSLWTPVALNGRRAWVAHHCAGYQGP
jgi:hypothetical protein